MRRAVAGQRGLVDLDERDQVDGNRHGAGLRHRGPEEARIRRVLRADWPAAAGAGQAAAISARMARAAARGSGAARTGRPTTMWSAPAARAAAGVAMRFWSPVAAPAGRMPGVTMSRPAASGRARMAGGLVRGGDDAVGAGGEGAARRAR